MTFRVVKCSVRDEASRLLREWWIVEERRKRLWWHYWRPLKRFADDSGGGSYVSMEFLSAADAWDAVLSRERNHPTGYGRWIEKRPEGLGWRT
jgi:hypothetical protein